MMCRNLLSRRAVLFGVCLTLWSGVGHAGENSAGRTKTGEVGDALEIVMPAVSLVGSLINKDWEGSKQFTYGLLSTIAVTRGLKATISKERPDGRDDDSFPSSHTAVAFQSATYLERRYGWRYGLPAYVAAAFVGHSRVHDERHDEEDVLVGAALGYLAGRLFTTKYENLEVVPLVGEEVVGITVRFTH